MLQGARTESKALVMGSYMSVRLSMPTVCHKKTTIISGSKTIREYIRTQTIDC